MTEREKVITGLECCQSKSHCEECPYIYEGLCSIWTCTADLASDALALLKEQEAVEPVVDVDTWACGNCNYPVERDRLIGPNALLNERYNYCPNCGKKVKWNDR